MVESCYDVQTYIQAYNGNIYPVADRTEWRKTNGPDILPPYYEKKCGRPKRSRRKNPEELEDGTKLSKHGVKMHCGYCRDPNHTRRNCSKWKADVAREEGVEQEPAMPQPQDEQEEEVGIGPAVEEQEDAATEPHGDVQHEASTSSKKPKRKRNPSLKAKEQQEAEKIYQEMRKKAKSFDENGDIDDPIILQVSGVDLKHIS